MVSESLLLTGLTLNQDYAFATLNPGVNASANPPRAARIRAESLNIVRP